MADLALPADLVKARMRDALKSCPCCSAGIIGFYEWPRDLDERFAEVTFHCGACIAVPHDGGQYQVSAGCPSPLADVLDDVWDRVLAGVEAEQPEPPEAA